MSEIKYPLDTLAERSPSHGRNNGRQEQWRATGGSLGSIVAGGALAVYGVTRKSAGGTALAAAGSLLAIRGIRKAVSPETVHVERSATINRPPNEVFSFFRNFENLPKFMPHLKDVQIIGDRASHWVARAPLGLELEWDVEILEEEQNRFLTWHSLPGAVIPNRGSVELRAASQYHGGCEITVAMDFAPPAGRGGAVGARIFGRHPGVQIREDLRRLKQLLEAGEIPTTEGQPHGRRTAFVRMVEAVNGPGHRRRTLPERPWAIVS